MPMTGIVKLFCILFLFPAGIASGQDDPSAAIAKAIGGSNAKALGRYFNEMVDLNIPGFKGNYSKTQSERIIQSFFTKYQVRSFSVSKQGNSQDGSKFNIGALDTGNKKYRVYYLYRLAGSVYRIFQFQIQEETNNDH